MVEEQGRLSPTQLFNKFRSQDYERHHISLRSCKGENHPLNLVYLSKKDHIIRVHEYLSMIFNKITTRFCESIFCFMTSTSGCCKRRLEIPDVEQYLVNESLLQQELAYACTQHSMNLKARSSKT